MVQWLRTKMDFPMRVGFAAAAPFHLYGVATDAEAVMWGAIGVFYLGLVAGALLEPWLPDRLTD
jgi:hypothetical protein